MSRQIRVVPWITNLWWRKRGCCKGSHDNWNNITIGGPWAQSISGVNTLWIALSVERRGQSMSVTIVTYGNCRNSLSFHCNKNIYTANTRHRSSITINLKCVQSHWWRFNDDCKFNSFEIFEHIFNDFYKYNPTCSTYLYL